MFGPTATITLQPLEQPAQTDGVFFSTEYGLERGFEWFRQRPLSIWSLEDSLADVRSYKSDAPKKQTPELAAARSRIRDVLDAQSAGVFGFEVATPEQLIDDPSGDELDAWLCAVQAAWACARSCFGAPQDLDPLEGWISYPDLEG